MKKAWLTIRSAALWAASLTYFGVGILLVMTLEVILGQRRIEPILAFALRNVVRLTGARFEVRVAPGFDPNRTCFFVSNHVNIFDPFVLYCAIPQLVRGLELESHFRVPVYGWLMKRFGNVPVADARTAGDVKRTFRLTKEKLAEGTSLIVFPEGSRTRDGRVGEFENGVFVMARQFKVPIVPASIVGSYHVHATGCWMLWPGRITVHLHEPIDVGDLPKDQIDALSARVREMIAGPVHEHLEQNPLPG